MKIFRIIKLIPYSIINKMRNHLLVKKYPWVHPVSWEPDDSGEYIEMRDPHYKYDYTMLFTNKTGWWKAFGKIFCDEIQEHYDECPNMYILEEKEKWGHLRISFGNANKAVDDICEKFEHISGNICMCCGALDVPMTDTGWLLPLCEDCYNKYVNDTRPYSEVICEKDPHIPTSYSWLRLDKEKGSVTETVDISDTVKKIRANYAKNR